MDKVIHLESGDSVKFTAGEEQYLLCCHCGLAHRILFDTDVKMTIFSADEMTKKERKRFLK